MTDPDPDLTLEADTAIYAVSHLMAESRDVLPADEWRELEILAADFCRLVLDRYASEKLRTDLLWKMKASKFRRNQ